MFFSKQVAGAAAFFLFGSSFLLAYGVSTSASAHQTLSSDAPVLIEPAVETVEAPATGDVLPVVEPAIAPAPAPATLKELVADWTQEAPLDAEARCLATAVFFESRSESLSGQLAVANVVIARAQSGRFPSSMCDVITQRGQFGFVRGGQLPKVPEYKPAWRTAKAIAQIALDRAWKNPVEGALFFHATYVSTNWRREQVAQIGSHIFYR